jgi:hypothetical protein
MPYELSFSNIFENFVIAEDLLFIRKFFFWRYTIHRAHILEVDLGRFENGGTVTVGILYLDKYKKDRPVLTFQCPSEDSKNLYETLLELNYPVKEFWKPYRMSKSREKLELLVRTRGSLRDIEPKELYD